MWESDGRRASQNFLGLAMHARAARRVTLGQLAFSWRIFFPLRAFSGLKRLVEPGFGVSGVGNLFDNGPAVTNLCGVMVLVVEQCDNKQAGRPKVAQTSLTHIFDPNL